MSRGNAGINHPLTANMMCFYEKKRKNNAWSISWKIIDLILSWGISTFNNIKNIVWKKQAQNVLEAKNC